MFHSVSEFIRDITGGKRTAADFGETDTRLAAAALLVHVVTSDNEFNEEEKAKLREVVAYRFELGLEEADKLVDAAIQSDREAVDLYHFTSVLNHSLGEEGRRRVVEMMFEVAYADSKLSEFEDNIVWRAAELLHIPARERVTIRRHMRDEITDKES